MVPGSSLHPLLGPSTQLGFVVRDLDAAVHHWLEVMGVGPWLFLDKGTGRPPNPAIFRGESVRVETRLAFGYLGDVQIELIEQVNDAPSPYREFLDAGREGLQHLGYWVHDHEEACRRVEAAGYVSEFVIPVPGQDRPIIYFRAPTLFGPMLEISPPGWKVARQLVYERLASWAGGDPLIRFDTYAAFMAEARTAKA